MSGSALSFKHMETEPTSGKQLLRVTRTLTAEWGLGSKPQGSFSHTIPCCLLYGKFVWMDSVSAVCSVKATTAIRLINDPVNPSRFSENHKLAISITSTGMVQFHSLCKLLRRTLGPKIRNSLCVVIRKSRKTSPFLFSAQVLKYNLNLGSRTWVAKQRQLRLVKSYLWTSQLLLKLGLQLLQDVQFMNISLLISC